MGPEEAGTEITEQISAFALILASFFNIEKKCFISLKYSDFVANLFAPSLPEYGGVYI